MALSFVLRRKGIASEAVAAQRTAILAGRYPSYRQQLEEIAALRGHVARRTLAGPQEGESETGYRQAVETLSRQIEELEAELARGIPELDVAKEIRASNVRAVSERIPTGGSLVEFIRIDRYDFAAVPSKGEMRWRSSGYLAFVLSSGGLVQLVDLGGAREIDKLVKDFRDSVSGEWEDRGGRDMVKRGGEQAAPPKDISGIELRRAVFDKLTPVLGQAERLVLAPDGDLCRLPFETLPIDDGRRLIDLYQISYVGCGRDVLWFGRRTGRKPGEPLVIADPEFDLQETGGHCERPEHIPSGRVSRDAKAGELHFPGLPGTRHEAECIGSLLCVRPWLGADVLETRLKRVKSPRILHIATHGFFLADQDRDPNEQHGWVASSDMGRLSGLRLENPLLRSGLALAGANSWLERRSIPSEAEDGLLTAEDLTGLDLVDTELVVLSACNTGMGEVRG